MRWCEFKTAAPEFAAAGGRLMQQADGPWIAMLASVSATGIARMAPICPIPCDGALYLSAGAPTPKVRDLERRGRYALHAFLGPSDEEWQIWGSAERVDDSAERARVHDTITFQFDAGDPIFHLDVERCLWGYWVDPGQPGTHPVKRRWP